MPKKILIIAYYWPPSGGSGVQRWAYFAKYLKSIGECEPIVITVDPKYASYPILDESLNVLTENVRSIKTKSFDLLRAYSLMKSGKSKGTIPHGTVGDKGKKSLFDKLSLHVRANYFIPDARVGWNRYALKKAQELINSEKIDCIITTGPPHSTHLVGLALKKKNSLTWIADFRDPWREVYYNELFKKSDRADKKDLQLEQEVLKKADYITTVGPSLKRLLANKIKGEENKIKVFHNGFDHELLASVSQQHYKTFTLAQIGVFTSKQPYESYIHFLKQLARKTSFNLELAGNVEEFILQEIDDIDGVNLINHGKVSHAKAISIMKSSHLLTNCLPLTKEAKLIISGKLMEYISTGNPILIIGEKDGDAGTLVKDNDAGEVFLPNEVEQMVDFALHVKSEMHSEKNTKYPVQFTRENISKSLSKFLSEL
jgi:glycosyltransferase involved in cell wall biosynthesis